MKHIVSFSGGRTSAYLVHLMEQKRKDEGWDVEYIFFETHGEHEKTYAFIRNIVKEWEIPFKILRVVINPELGKGNSYEEISIDEMGWKPEKWLDLTRKYGNPTAISMHCTRELKTNVMQSYCKQFDEFTVWIGIRADEKRRLKAKNNIRYLAEISPMDKTDIIGWWREQSFDLGLDEHLGNCVFCVKKSIPKLALAAIDEPELFEQWKALLTHPDVRVKYQDRPVDAIYRGILTPNGIAKMYADQDRDQLYMSMKHARKFETGACTESCEVFSDQMDLFAEDAV